MSTTKQKPATKDAFIAATCVFIITIATSVTVCFFSYKGILSEIQNHLVSTAKIAASYTNGDAHKTLTKPEQKHSPEYIDIKNHYQKILSADPKLRFIYSAVYKGGDVYFVVDSGPQKNSDNADIRQSDAEIMEKYDDATPTFIKALRENVAIAEDSTSEDDWGSTISGYAPIYDSKSKQVGIVGVDIDAADLQKKIAYIWYALAFITIVAIFISSAVFVVVKNLRNREKLEEEKRILQLAVLQEFGTKIQTIIKSFSIVTEKIHDLTKSISEITQKSSAKSSDASTQVKGAAGRIFSIGMVCEELTDSAKKLQDFNFNLSNELYSAQRAYEKLAQQGTAEIKIQLSQLKACLDKIELENSNAAAISKSQSELAFAIVSDISGVAKNAMFIENIMGEFEGISAEAAQIAQGLFEAALMLTQQSSVLNREVSDFVEKF